MRKSSYLFLAVVGLTPAILFWHMNRVSEAYESEHGMPPEGMGFFAVMVLAIRCMFLFAILALVCAARAYCETPAKSSATRKIELAFFCLPIVAIIALVVLVVPQWPGRVYVLTGHL